MRRFPNTPFAGPGSLALIAVVISCVLALPTGRDRGPAPLPTPGAPAAPVAPAPSAWWNEVQGRIAVEEYGATRVEGRLQAPNRAQGLRTHFGSDRLSIVPRTSPSNWEFRWATDAWGRGGTLEPVAPAEPVALESRVEYRRGALVEWYENDARGVEQGFTIASAPPGQGPLRVRARLEATGLRPVPANDGRGLGLCDAAGVEQLRYAGLVAFDADGRDLPARLELDRERVEIVVDDAHARYPLTIDPLVTTPAWSHEGDAINAQFGYSVATAGDVNRDGFSDLIVGAPGFDNGDNRAQGKAFVFIGGANGPPAVANWEAKIDAVGGISKFGQCVAGVGDLNGDGYGDIAVGAPGHFSEVNESAEGFAYVWLGGPSGGGGGSSGLGAFGTQANADWRAEANLNNSDLGMSVAYTGDLNGDGYDDLGIGAPRYSNGEANEGVVFVWMGGANDLGSNGTPANCDWLADSNDEDSQFGFSVAGVGDVNGDGYDDLLAGAPLGNAALMWLGGANGLGANGTVLNADWAATGTQADAHFGYSVAAAGDVNGDGYADVVIGAPRYDDGAADTGKSFVWLGGPNDLGNGGSPANADWSYGGVVAGAHMGWSVATAGDIDGDGFADVVVGSPTYAAGQNQEGRAQLFRGTGGGLAATPIWTRSSNEVDAEFGFSVAAAGDVNGDGFGDVLVGAAIRTGDLAFEGQAMLFLGSAQGPEGIASWFGENNVAGSRFGSAVAAAGDVNGDGYDDVLVAAPDYDGGHNGEGRVYLFVGQAIGLALNSSWTAEGNQTDAGLGGGLSSAGDVNHDGYDDVVIGAEDYDSDGLIDNGAAFLWFGGAAGLGANGTPVNADWRADGTQDGESLGSEVAFAGDVNGDGFADVAVAGYGWDGGQQDEGHVLVFHGQLAGLAAVPAWTEERNQADEEFGRGLSGAGDVNADGYSDLIVGAPGYDGSHANEGRVWVYHGSSNGLSQSASWFGDVDQVSTGFGWDVAAAGDVNGDGYSDVIVGAHLYDGDLADEGRAFVYYGSAGGLSASADWTAESNQGLSLFGTCVAGAGDVNGDGYGDVMVGAHAYLVGGVETGRAFLWLGGSGGLGANGTPTNADWNDFGAQLGALDMGFGMSLAGAGDVDGDGFSDIAIGAPQADDPGIDEGAAFVFYGNGGHGQDRAVMQRRHDDQGRVSLLGFATSETAFRIRARARGAGGRGRAKLEYEFRTLGGPFTPGNTARSANWTDTGAPGAQGSVTTLNDFVSFAPGLGVMRWRARVASDTPFFPHGPWLSISGNGRTEGDIRFLNGVLAVGPEDARPIAFALAGAHPFQERIALRFTLPVAARVRLEVLDVAGRRVATLLDDDRSAGTHEIEWNGRNLAGAASLPGVYFARLSAGTQTRTLKLVRAG